MVRTIWNTGDIWLRRTFNPGALTAEQVRHLALNVHHDEDVEIYLNGVLAYSATGFIGNYLRVPMNEAGRRALLSDKENVLAVHCHQTVGGQFIDVGLDERVVLVPPPSPSAALDALEIPGTNSF